MNVNQSRTQRTIEIENLCITNVACRFAEFCDPKSAYRGPNFRWDWFVGYVQREASVWLLTIYTEETIDEDERKLAETTSKEFAEKLIKNMLDSI